MKKIILTAFLVLLSVAPSFAGESLADKIDIDGVLKSLYNRQVLKIGVNDKTSAEMNERFINANKSVYGQWEESAPDNALNRYRKGVYFFIEALSSQTDEYFRKALPLLEEAKAVKADKDLIGIAADKMIEICKSTRAKRIEFAETLKKQNKAAQF